MSKQDTAQTQVTNNPNDNNPHTLKSKTTIAATGSKSLRATVPEGIVAFLELQPSDKLEWFMDTTNSQRQCIVRKVNP